MKKKIHDMTIYKIWEDEKLHDTIMEEITRLRRKTKIDGIASHVYHQLEMLRYVRNTARGLTFEEGVKEEDAWIVKQEKNR